MGKRKELLRLGWETAGGVRNSHGSNVVVPSIRPIWGGLCNHVLEICYPWQKPPFPDTRCCWFIFFFPHTMCHMYLLPSSVLGMCSWFWGQEVCSQELHAGLPLGLCMVVALYMAGEQHIRHNEGLLHPVTLPCYSVLLSFLCVHQQRKGRIYSRFSQLSTPARAGEALLLSAVPHQASV